MKKDYKISVMHYVKIDNKSWYSFNYTFNNIHLGDFVVTSDDVLYVNVRHFWNNDKLVSEQKNHIAKIMKNLGLGYVLGDHDLFYDKDPQTVEGSFCRTEEYIKEKNLKVATLECKKTGARVKTQ